MLREDIIGELGFDFFVEGGEEGQASFAEGECDCDHAENGLAGASLAEPILLAQMPEFKLAGF